jgi:hypothetical protein
MKKRHTPIKMLLPVLGISLMAAIFLNTAAYQHKSKSKNPSNATQIEVKPSSSSALPDVALLKKLFHLSSKFVTKAM